MIDLHSHSTASDGALAPAELIRLAASLGLKAIALTDHDTVAGIAEARAEASLAGIGFIAGVEIEIEFSPGEFHLLGLGLDEGNAKLVRALKELSSARRDRNAKIAQLLRESGMEIDLEQLERKAGLGQVGRPHLAQALLEQRVVRTKQEAFDKYLGKGKPFYLPKECLSLDRALALIEDSGGIPVVAHPYSLFISKTKLAPLMDEWKDSGIRGIEAYHPAAKPGQCRSLELMARQRGFLVTAGSDFHGPGKPECGLGKSSGGYPIEDRYLDELLAVPGFSISRSESFVPSPERS